MDTAELIADAVDAFTAVLVAALETLLNALLGIIGDPLIQTILDLFGASS